MDLLFVLLIPIILLVVSFFLICLCYLKCRKERAGAGGGVAGAVVPAFVAPADVPGWVTTPSLLVHHYYMSSMYSLVRAAAKRYFSPSWRRQFKKLSWASFNHS